jgi:hypothetical protein
MKTKNRFRNNTEVFDNPKIIELENAFGVAGYWIYVSLLALMVKQPGYVLSSDVMHKGAGNLTLPGYTLEMVKQIADKCVQLDLLRFRDGQYSISGNNPILAGENTREIKSSPEPGIEES